MSMLSGQGLGPTSDGPRKRHPVTTGIVVLLMCLVLFGATYGAVRLLRGSSTPDASTPSGSASLCVTTTVVPGVTLPKPGQVTSNVFNATSRAGLAKRTSADLQSRGFVIGRVANDPLSKKVTGVGEIRYGANGLANAQLMRYYVLGAALVADGRKDATVDVVLGDAFKAITPQKAVDAALKKPTPVVSGTGCAPAGKPSTKPSTKPTAASPSPSA